MINTNKSDKIAMALVRTGTASIDLVNLSLPRTNQDMKNLRLQIVGLAGQIMCNLEVNVAQLTMQVVAWQMVGT